jgi:hypothetical protein
MSSWEELGVRLTSRPLDLQGKSFKGSDGGPRKIGNVKFPVFGVEQESTVAYFHALRLGMFSMKTVLNCIPKAFVISYFRHFVDSRFRTGTCNRLAMFGLAGKRLYVPCL